MGDIECCLDIYSESTEVKQKPEYKISSDSKSDREFEFLRNIPQILTRLTNQQNTSIMTKMTS